MSEFVRERIGENRYKAPRMDGKQELTIEPSLVDEFAELEVHQWDNWKNSSMAMSMLLIRRPFHFA